MLKGAMLTRNRVQAVPESGDRCVSREVPRWKAAAVATLSTSRVARPTGWRLNGKPSDDKPQDSENGTRFQESSKLTDSRQTYDVGLDHALASPAGPTCEDARLTSVRSAQPKSLDIRTLPGPCSYGVNDLMSSVMFANFQPSASRRY